MNESKKRSISRIDRWRSGNKMKCYWLREKLQPQWNLFTGPLSHQRDHQIAIGTTHNEKKNKSQIICIRVSMECLRNAMQHTARRPRSSRCDCLREPEVALALLSFELRFEDVRWLCSLHHCTICSASRTICAFKFNEIVIDRSNKFNQIE